MFFHINRFLKNLCNNDSERETISSVENLVIDKSSFNYALEVIYGCSSVVKTSVVNVISRQKNCESVNYSNFDESIKNVNFLSFYLLFDIFEKDIYFKKSFDRIKHNTMDFLNFLIICFSLQNNNTKKFDLLEEISKRIDNFNEYFIIPENIDIFIVFFGGVVEFLKKSIESNGDIKNKTFPVFTKFFRSVFHLSFLLPRQVQYFCSSWKFFIFLDTKACSDNLNLNLNKSDLSIKNVLIKEKISVIDIEKLDKIKMFRYRKIYYLQKILEFRKKMDEQTLIRGYFLFFKLIEELISENRNIDVCFIENGKEFDLYSVFFHHLNVHSVSDMFSEFLGMLEDKRSVEILSNNYIKIVNFSGECFMKAIHSIKWLFVIFSKISDSENLKRIWYILMLIAEYSKQFKKELKFILLSETFVEFAEFKFSTKNEGHSLEKKKPFLYFESGKLIGDEKSSIYMDFLKIFDQKHFKENCMKK